MTLLIDNDMVNRLLTMEDCIAVLEEAYQDLAAAEAVNRPKTNIYVPQRPGRGYNYCTMEGVFRKAGVAAIRMKSDMLENETAFREKRVVKWASGPGKFCGLILLFSIDNAEPLAIINDGLIQQMRVGATSGIAARYLARSDAETVGVIGSAGQARSHLRAFAAVRNIKSAKVYSPNPEHRTVFAEEMGNLLDIDVRPVETLQEAVTDSDIVTTCTNSRQPLVKGEWIEDGMHITCVNLRELGEEIFNWVDLTVWHQQILTAVYTVGKDEELRLMPRTPGKKRFKLPENAGTLDRLVAGRIKGRTCSTEKTFFHNNEGAGIQFAAVGSLVYRLAKEKGLGKILPTEWFLQTVKD